MNNDDSYDEDHTLLAAGFVEDDATNPVQQAAPEHLRRRVEGRETDDTAPRTATSGQLDADEMTVERQALDPSDFEGLNVDETFERPRPPRPAPHPSTFVAQPSEDRTVMRPAPAAPSAPPRPSPNPSRGVPIQPPVATPAAKAAPAPHRPPTALQPKRPSNPSSRELPPSAGDQLRRLGLARRKPSSAASIRPNSGFYSLPEANPGEGIPDVTVQHVYVERDPHLLGFLVALVTGIASAFAILTLSLSRWSSPGESMAYTLLAMVLCSVIVGGVALPNQDLKLSGLRDAFLPMGLAVALTLIAGLAWQLSFVRTELRWIASSAPEMSRRVLTDSAHTVALDECLRISERYEYAVWRGVLVDTLVGRTDVRDACLEQMAPEASAKLSATLSDRWYAEVLDGENETDRACETAQSLSLLKRPAGEVESRLLACVLRGPSEAVQRCCGTTLIDHAEGNWIATLRDAENYSSDAQTAAGLMTLAFHQEGVSNSQMEFVKAADFQGASARATALVFACNSVLQGGQNLANHFGASLGSKCPVDVGKLPRGREIWLAACDLALPKVRENVKKPQDALCESTKDALMLVAISDARRIISNAAKDRTSAEGLATAIDVQGTKELNSKPKFRTVRDRKKRLAQERKAMGDAAPIAKPTFRPEW